MDVDAVNRSLAQRHWVYIIETVPPVAANDSWIVPCRGRSYKDALEEINRLAEDLLDRGDDEPEFTIKCRLTQWPASAFLDVENFDLDELDEETMVKDSPAK